MAPLELSVMSPLSSRACLDQGPCRIRSFNGCSLWRPPKRPKSRSIGPPQRTQSWKSSRGFVRKSTGRDTSSNRTASERTNKEVVLVICAELDNCCPQGAHSRLITLQRPPRPILALAIDPSRISTTVWEPRHGFGAGIAPTVR